MNLVIDPRSQSHLWEARGDAGTKTGTMCDQVSLIDTKGILYLSTCWTKKKKFLDLKIIKIDSVKVSYFNEVYLLPFYLFHKYWIGGAFKIYTYSIFFMIFYSLFQILPTNLVFSYYQIYYELDHNGTSPPPQISSWMAFNIEEKVSFSSKEYKIHTLFLLK